MAQYKVPQNVESEDKILGPLSLKQFIYVIIGLMWAALMWAIFNKVLVLAIVFALPVTGFFLLLGFGRRQEQSFENYFVALLRFQFVPRKRLWMKDEKLDTSIVKESDRPKESAVARNPRQIKGQLAKLSLVLDTHGATGKDEQLQLPESNIAGETGDRVIGPQAQDTNRISGNISLPQADLLDLQNNERATNVGQMLEQTGENIRKQALARMQQATPNENRIADNVSRQINENATIKEVMYNPNLSIAQVSNKINQTQNNQS